MPDIQPGTFNKFFSYPLICLIIRTVIPASDSPTPAYMQMSRRWYSLTYKLDEPSMIE